MKQPRRKKRQPLGIRTPIKGAVIIGILTAPTLAEYEYKIKYEGCGHEAWLGYRSVLKRFRGQTSNPNCKRCRAKKLVSSKVPETKKPENVLWLWPPLPSATSAHFIPIH